MDDAGRGCVIGPLVVAGVLMNEEDIPILGSLGVRDSKKLTPRQREILAGEIRRVALKCCVRVVPPNQIDEVVTRGVKLRRLNWLEARVMAEVISELKPDVAYVDASDVVAERFGQQIVEFIPSGIKVISEHNADAKYVVVSAASIIAKTERDSEIAKLRREYGDFGSGYPSDERTIQFLRTWLKRHGSYPDFVRKSWETAKKLMREVGEKQTRLM